MEWYYKIEGQPGIADIVKQYFYMLSILPQQQNISHIANFFLVPKLSQNESQKNLFILNKPIESLSVDLFYDTIFNQLFKNDQKLLAIFSKIYILEINANELMKRFLIKNEIFDIFEFLKSHPYMIKSF